MSAHALLNLLNELGKKIRCEFNKSSPTILLHCMCKKGRMVDWLHS